MKCFTYFYVIFLFPSSFCLFIFFIQKILLVVLAVGVCVNGDVSHLLKSSEGYHYDAPAASEVNELTGDVSAPRLKSLEYLPPIGNSIENKAPQFSFDVIFILKCVLYCCCSIFFFNFLIGGICCSRHPV